VPKSFKIRGIEPSDLATFPTGVKKQYWGWVVEFGLKRKDKELSQGLDKDGKPLRPITAKTRKYRRSAMTPSGKGSPTAPPLTPAYAKSRTRSLLDGRALSTHAEFFWRFDAFTGDQWGAVLEFQAKQGRDVFGLSDQGTRRVQQQALRRWEAHKAGRPVKERQRAAQPVYGEFVGRKPDATSEFGIGTRGIGVHGGMTAAELRAHYTEERAVNIPGRPKQAYNRILAHVWGGAGPRAQVVGKIAVKPPKPVPIVQRVAMKPKPEPKPEAPQLSFVQAVLLAIDKVPHGQGFGSLKVWIYDVWVQYTRLPGIEHISLTEFKIRIVGYDALRARMSRLDMVQSVNFEDVRRSETEYRIGSTVVAEFHFFRRR
jgi:hypothetical protein